MTNFWKSLCLCLLAVTFSTKAYAQYLMEPTWSPPNYLAYYNIQNNPVVNSVINAGRESAVSRQPVAQSASRENPSEILQQAQFATTYTPSRARTLANQSALLSRARASNRGSADQLEQIFQSTDVIGAVKGVMSNYGLDPNDASHAYAVYWVAYWSLANKHYADISQQEMQAVARQSAEVFSTNAEFGALDNAAKQKSAEEFLVFAAILDATLDQAEATPALESQIVEAAIRGSRASGLGLDKMVLTNDGFKPK
jgi:hypothetical protein